MMMTMIINKSNYNNNYMHNIIRESAKIFWLSFAFVVFVVVVVVVVVVVDAKSGSNQII